MKINFPTIRNSDCIGTLWIIHQLLVLIAPNNKEVTRIIDKKDLYRTNKVLEEQLEANRQARINENIAIQEKIMMMEEEFELYGTKEN